LSEKQQALRHWLDGRVDSWQWLEQQCRQQGGARQQSSASSIEFVEGFRALGSDLSLARTTFPDSRLVKYLAGLFARSYEQIYRRPSALWYSIKDVFLHEAPAIVYDIRRVLAATISLFLLSILCGWWLVYSFPDLAGLFASQKMIDTVEAGGLWTDNLLNILPSSILSLSIISNNIIVTLFAFVLGAFYGIGTVYIISLNGLMLGGVFAFTAHNGLAGRLFEFIIAHGVVELSVICLAGAAGVYLGESLIRPGNRTRTAAFRLAVRRAGALLLVAIPFLVGAGFIEGYVSPNDAFPLATRLVVGLGYGVVFWLVLARGFWQQSAVRVTHPS
jgi:uncharacterized membrane protein SpoIIM required for sporulation